MLPNFIIAGAPKSGTTSLYHYLRFHPGIFLPQRKEIMFFDVNYSKGLSWYKKCFRNISGESAVGEISPTYMHKPNVPKRIYETISNTKLIFMLRNPIERAYSHYFDLKGWGIKGSFMHTLKNPPPIRRAINSYVDFDILEMGYYFKHINRFKSYFNSDRIGIFLFDDFIINPEKTLENICQFLDVKNLKKKEAVIRKKYHTRGVNRSKLLGNILVSEELRSLAYALLPDILFPHFRRFYDLLLSLNTKHIKTAPMKETERLFLKNKYYQDIKNLENLLARDLNHWLM